MQALAHPFRFYRGRAVVLDSDSDAYAAQIIAQAVQTGRGELLLTPTYGLDAAEFATLDTAGLIYTISTFHPSILINSVDRLVEDEQSTVKLKINFTNLNGS